MRGISTGSGGTTSSGMRPDASNVRCPQFAVSVSTSASPLATVARSWMFEKPGSSRGDRIRPVLDGHDEIRIDRLQRALRACRSG